MLVRERMETSGIPLVRFLVCSRARPRFCRTSHSPAEHTCISPPRGFVKIPTARRNDEQGLAGTPGQQTRRRGGAATEEAAVGSDASTRFRAPRCEGSAALSLLFTLDHRRQPADRSPPPLHLCKVARTGGDASRRPWAVLAGGQDITHAEASLAVTHSCLHVQVHTPTRKKAAGSRRRAAVDAAGGASPALALSPPRACRSVSTRG